jgi:hypothetical protein
MFPLITPVAIMELLFLRALARPWLRRLRPNLIAALQKRDERADQLMVEASGHRRHAGVIASAP